MTQLNRRNFLTLSGLALPALAAGKGFTPYEKKRPPQKKYAINFLYDSYWFSPTEYISVLNEINSKKEISTDIYGSGGDLEVLEKKMADITGKEKAIYMPSGTLANLLAISVLSGEKARVAVQQNSHIYRDEGDAAESVFGKRLIPFPAEKSAITLDDVKTTLAYSESKENFIYKSDLGAISIENPVRRGFGQQVAFEEIKKIAAFCKQQNYKLHLDGARIFVASAYSGISVKDYSKYFDTVYISLYKYLGAAAGAVLCGDAEVIGKMQHLIKIHGGTVPEALPYTAVALHFLDGIENRFHQTVENGNKIIAGLNKIAGFRTTPVENGTNIFFLDTGKGNPAMMSKYLSEKYGIQIRKNFTEGRNGIAICINESQLQVSPEFIVNAFEEALHSSI